MQKLRVFYYGFFSEITGKEREEVDIEEGATKSVKEIVDPKLSQYLENAVILVNGVAVRPDYRVKVGDEVRVLPHIGGG